MRRRSTAYQNATLAHLHAMGIELADVDSQAYTLILLDDVSARLLDAWLALLREEDMGVPERVEPFDAVLSYRPQGVPTPFLRTAYDAVDPEDYEQLVLLGVAGLRYIDWRAGRAGRGFETPFVEECAASLAQQARYQKQAEGSWAGYVADLTPTRFPAGLLDELVRQSADEGMEIFG